MKRLRSFVPSTFQQIEKNYGDINALVDTKMSILKLKANQVTERSLKKLFRHEVAAIRVPNFFPAEACDYLSESFLEQPTSNWKVSSSRGMESSDVESIVTPYNVALGRGPECIQQYFENAKHFTQSLRQNGGRQTASTNASTTQLDDRGGGGSHHFIFPTLTPIDLLRLQLDETWPDGATIGKDTKSGNHLLAGAVRIMRGAQHGSNNNISSQGFIHVDDLSVMQNNGGLFSANVYLKTPTYGGGELEIFPITFRTRYEFIKNAVTLSRLTDPSVEAQELLRAALPRPLILTPEPGELILICAQRPHAAKGFNFQTGDIRVSMQTFLTYEEGKPIVLDS